MEFSAPVPSEFAESLSQIDGDAYLNTVCSTDIKTKHFYVYILEFLIMFLIMAYGGAVKLPLRKLKMSYFMYYRHPIPEFAEMPIRFNCSEREFDRELKRRMYMNTMMYIVAKTCCMVVLLTLLIAILCIKYAIPHSREFFLPVETKCGPKLVITVL